MQGNVGLDLLKLLRIFLRVDPLAELRLASLQVLFRELAHRLDRERARAKRGLAQPVTLDTRPQRGVVLSDTANTGYDLGIRTGAVVLRLGCQTDKCTARRYTGWRR